MNDPIRLVSEAEEAETEVAAVDAQAIVRRVIELADKGFWQSTVKLPNGRRRTVRAIVDTFGLHRLVRHDLNCCEN